MQENVLKKVVKLEKLDVVQQTLTKDLTNVHTTTEKFNGFKTHTAKITKHAKKEHVLEQKMKLTTMLKLQMNQ